MADNSPFQLFNTRRKTLPSTLSMTGCGINVVAQVAALCELGTEPLSDLKRVNICSTSVFSFLVTHAHVSRNLYHNRLDNLNEEARRIHGCGIGHYLSQYFKVAFSHGSFFTNQQLCDLSHALFDDDFLTRPLSTLPDNICFWAYCTKKNVVTKISTQTGFGEMTLGQVIRACASAPKLHGSYLYKNRAFIDVLYSPQAKPFIKQIQKNQGNHLVINSSKTEQKPNGTLLVKSPLSTKPKSDYYRFMLNMGNPAAAASQREAIVALQQWPQLKREKPRKPQTQLISHARTLASNLIVVTSD